MSLAPPGLLSLQICVIEEPNDRLLSRPHKTTWTRKNNPNCQTYSHGMAIPKLPLNPLARASEEDLLTLASTLWQWSLCALCIQRLPCQQEEPCSSQRLKRLQRFLEFYKTLTASYEGNGSGYPALRTHGDILVVLQQLKSKPASPRSELRETLFRDVWCDRPLPPECDQNAAIDLAVKVMTMVNCSASGHSVGLLEHGNYQIPWRGDTGLVTFFENILPLTDHPGLNDSETKVYMDIKPSLMARKVKKRIGMTVRPTNDLRSHLRIDRRTNTLEVFHHVTFLKEHLRLTKDHPRNLTIEKSLSIGAIPRQLALECLDSVQKILFPLSDAKSRSLLQSLTTRFSFDPDCLRFESASIRNADEKDIKYYYFGGRLADLYDELEHPRPRGWLQRRIERRSGARYIMMVTLAGVLFALVLGIVGIAINGYQAWVGYQQWQHPVNIVH